MMPCIIESHALLHLLRPLLSITPRDCSTLPSEVQYKMERLGTPWHQTGLALEKYALLITTRVHGKIDTADEARQR